jgi:acetyl esterase/lipase
MPLADVSRIRRKWLDLPYARTSPAQKLDIYLPDTGDVPFPVIFHIHGGAFAMGDKRDLQLEPFLRGLTRGYALASVNYRLSGEAIFPAAVQDLKASLRWLRANCRHYHLDPERIAACGGSSGGNLAAMLCMTGNVRDLEDPSLGNPDCPADVQAAVDWFGPTDFLKMDEQLTQSGLGRPDHGQADSPESRYLGAPLEQVPERVRRANPITYIHDKMPPILIQHGRIDPLVPVQQSIILAEEIRRRVGSDRVEFDILEGAGHGDPLFETEDNMKRVFSFLDRRLERRERG